MNPKAQPYLEAVSDPEIRGRLAVFFDAYDAMDRENTHLRLLLQADHKCPYGHMTDGRCALGYPGCACMDDLMAMASWNPEDEEKASVRLGRVLAETQRHLDIFKRALAEGAVILEAAGEPKLAKTFIELAQAAVRVDL